MATFQVTFKDSLAQPDSLGSMPGRPFTFFPNIDEDGLGIGCHSCPGFRYGNFADSGFGRMDQLEKSRVVLHIH